MAEAGRGHEGQALFSLPLLRPQWRADSQQLQEMLGMHLSHHGQTWRFPVSLCPALTSEGGLQMPLAITNILLPELMPHFAAALWLG